MGYTQKVYTFLLHVHLLLRLWCLLLFWKKLTNTLNVLVYEIFLENFMVKKKKEKIIFFFTIFLMNMVL